MCQEPLTTSDETIRFRRTPVENHWYRFIERCVKCDMFVCRLLEVVAFQVDLSPRRDEKHAAALLPSRRSTFLLGRLR